MHGFGVYVWNHDQSKYSGSFVENAMEGFGILTYKDGRKYEGFFKADKK